MHIEQLFSLIEQYRPLTGLSSLPFLMCDIEKPPFLWFNYFVKQTQSQLRFSVTTLYACSDGVEVTQMPLSLEIDVPLTEYDEPELMEDEYVMQLLEMPGFCSEATLFELLEQAEMKPLLPVYRAVLHHAMQG